MTGGWERHLERWTRAGLIETSTADRVRAYEADQEKAGGLRWPILLAIAFGGLLLAAGILLFVAAHWDRLSPRQRFTLVLALVGVFHIAGAIAAGRFGILSTALHAVGTICLGAGIFLTGQIFHLQEHWPGGVMLWAFGALAAWAFLRDWPQAALAAILTPGWLAGEWVEATHDLIGGSTVLSAGLLLWAVSYLTALLPGKTTPVRKALAWIGGLTLIPIVAFVVQSGSFSHREFPLSRNYMLLGWAAAFLFPLALAWWLRGRSVWLNVIAAVWVAALSATSLRYQAEYAGLVYSRNDLLMYVVCALGSIGLIAWGMREDRKERVNLGIAGFGLTVLFFYFSTVMDKLGRSASLIGLGLLFLLGGWLLEKIRRRLLVQLAGC
ncbi:MAG: DUF2157 domain-containing protein [Deltaproteobacteria bacterium HGW-Deltaproteobacteria-21]|nr:MAG: DUF2157 domain-containing protein [Deltaproteobacteria bacterium HGW-Deltaproteobacteria-21]